MRRTKHDDQFAAMIKGMLKRGDDSKELAKFFNIDRKRVFDIRAGRTYSNVKARRRDLPALTDPPMQWYRPRVDQFPRPAAIQDVLVPARLGEVTVEAIEQIAIRCRDIATQMDALGTVLRLSFTNSLENPRNEEATTSGGRSGRTNKRGRADGGAAALSC